MQKHVRWNGNLELPVTMWKKTERFNVASFIKHLKERAVELARQAVFIMLPECLNGNVLTLLVPPARALRKQLAI